MDRDLLAEGERRITQYLQGRGYFQAKTSFEVREGAGGRQTVVFRVDPGPKFKLASVAITGNQYFDRATLKERMAVTPATRLRYRNGRFSELILESDVIALEELYRSNGFRDVKITTEVKTRLDRKDNFLDVVVRIDEGRQWLIESFELTGVDEELVESLRALAGSQEGQPFSEMTVAVDRDQILGYFYNRGFPAAIFDWKADTGSEEGRVALRYEVKPGDPLSVRGVLVSGLKTSRPEMVNDRIRIEPGEPLSQARIVESQRMLHDLGVFARVDTALQNPDGDEKSKYVQFQFEEARRWSMNMGMGAEFGRFGGGGDNITAPAGQTGFSPRVSLGLSRMNLFGFGHTISAQTRLSYLQQRTLASYLVPHFIGQQNLSLTITGFNDLTRDVNTFTGRRQEASGQLTQVISRSWTVQGRYAYRRNTVSDLVIDPDLIPLYSQPVLVGIASGTVIRDKRDNPINSTRGQYHYVDFGVASRKLGGETSYTRAYGRTSNYHRIGRGMVFAHSFSLGWQYNLDTAAGAAGIPLPERFYSGGASTHRGFPINQAGPRDTETGFPLGGSALLMNNFELRFPLIGDNLGGVLFHDAGNVYASFEKISFRVIQKNVQDFDYMVHAVGMGFRYETPIGPVRFDFAYGPNSPRFFGFKGSYDELISGQGEKVLQRVSRFQFHFSFGQTF
jgi:outer membrane protein assembly complex protein YaeT